MATPSLDTTIKAIQGGLTSLAADKGVKNIEGWMQQLDEAEFRGAKTIRDNLGKLKRHLESGNLDGAAIGELLGTLGQATVRAASNAQGAQGRKIQQLGELLSQSAGDLGGSSQRTAETASR
jgi:hypothetical protein